MCVQIALWPRTLLLPVRAMTVPPTSIDPPTGMSESLARAPWEKSSAGGFVVVFVVVVFGAVVLVAAVALVVAGAEVVAAWVRDVVVAAAPLDEVVAAGRALLDVASVVTDAESVADGEAPSGGVLLVAGAATGVVALPELQADRAAPPLRVTNAPITTT
jgi:hypothetical protein